jgi:DNA repair protein RadC
MKPYHENKISIKAWAEEDRPREKLSAQGRRALTDAELIAILISSGNDSESAVELSKRILHHYDNDLNKLAKATINDLCNFRGIGEAKAISIIAALEVGRRRSETEEKTPEFIRTSKDAWSIMRRHLVDLNHEEFWIILVGRSSKVLGKELVSKGGLSNTIADPKIIFGAALQYQATGIILVHNHPSGNLDPSRDDINLTKQLSAAGRLLSIQILDHLIITDSTYMSFADKSLL